MAFSALVVPADAKIGPKCFYAPGRIISAFEVTPPAALERRGE
jgi:hypothetical protein